MRYVLTVAIGLLLGIAGYVLGSRSSPSPPRGSYERITSGRERLRAGYAEIPAANQGCSGNQRGLIVIRLEKLMERLHAGQTIIRKISYFEKPQNADDPQQPGAVDAVVPLEPNEQEQFFATQLDFSTRLRTVGGDPVLVKPGRFVMVRVVLDRATNPGAEFLHPDEAGSPADSDFAVMASTDTARKNMLFCRKPIANEPWPGGNPYVEFGIRSTGGPTTGSFGIGLLIREPGSRFVTPIVLDPAVRNEG